MITNIKNTNNFVLSLVSSICCISLIVFFILNILDNYDKKAANKDISDRVLVDIYQAADSNDLNLIEISKTNSYYTILKNKGLSSDYNYILNLYISSWMHRYNYTKKYINIVVVD